MVCHEATAGSQHRQSCFGNAVMADNFPYDVLLSRSSNDKPVVRAIAERPRADGLRVWFDEEVSGSERTVTSFLIDSKARQSR